MKSWVKSLEDSIWDVFRFHGFSFEKFLKIVVKHFPGEVL